MISDSVLTRQEHLQKLNTFCRALDKALARAGVVPRKSLEAWREAVGAQCVQCGIEVSGQELLALSQPPSAELDSAKICRLRLGDCARKGCTSYYYRLTFRPYLEVNWPEILAQAETIKDEPAEQAPSKPARSTPGLSILWHLPAISRIGGVFLLVLLFLILRQWYIGGRIPLLREPQKFQAAPDSIATALTNG